MVRMLGVDWPRLAAVAAIVVSILFINIVILPTNNLIVSPHSAASEPSSQVAAEPTIPIPSQSYHATPVSSSKQGLASGKSKEASPSEQTSPSAMPGGGGGAGDSIFPSLPPVVRPPEEKPKEEPVQFGYLGDMIPSVEKMNAKGEFEEIDLTPKPNDTRFILKSYPWMLLPDFERFVAERVLSEVDGQFLFPIPELNRTVVKIPNERVNTFLYMARAYGVEPEEDKLNEVKMYQSRQLISVNPLFSSNYTGKNVTIGFVDTGISTQHQDFEGRITNVSLFGKSYTYFYMGYPCFNRSMNFTSNVPTGYPNFTATVLSGTWVGYAENKSDASYGDFDFNIYNSSGHKIFSSPENGGPISFKSIVFNSSKYEGKNLTFEVVYKNYSNKSCTTFDKSGTKRTTDAPALVMYNNQSIEQMIYFNNTTASRPSGAPNSTTGYWKTGTLFLRGYKNVPAVMSDTKPDNDTSTCGYWNTPYEYVNYTQCYVGYDTISLDLDGDGNYSDANLTMFGQTKLFGLNYTLSTHSCNATESGSGFACFVSRNGILAELWPNIRYYQNLPEGLDFEGSAVRLTPDGYSKEDYNGHGTHVAGIAAGSGEASGGNFRGVAPEANILMARAFDRYGSGYTSDITQGILWLTQQGADVISLSYGRFENTTCQGTDIDAIDWAIRQGKIVAIAAGNGGELSGGTDFMSIEHPGCFGPAITVGAAYNGTSYLNVSIRRAEYSSLGPTIEGLLKPDIYAIGGANSRNDTPQSCGDRRAWWCGIDAPMAFNGFEGTIKHEVDANYYKWSPGMTAVNLTNSDSHYLRNIGTSMSTPMVAGAAAVLLQQYANYSQFINQSVMKEALVNSASMVWATNVSSMNASDWNRVPLLLNVTNASLYLNGSLAGLTAYHDTKLSVYPYFQNISVGRSNALNITLDNNGTVLEKYSVSANVSWCNSFDYPNISVAAKTKLNITMNCTAPSNQNKGTYTVLVQATSGANSWNTTTTIQVVDPANLTITLNQPSLNELPTSYNLTVKVNVTNNGGNRATAVIPNVVWTVNGTEDFPGINAFTVSSISSLKKDLLPNESYYFEINYTLFRPYDWYYSSYAIHNLNFTYYDGTTPKYTGESNKSSVVTIQYPPIYNLTTSVSSYGPANNSNVTINASMFIRHLPGVNMTNLTLYVNVNPEAGSTAQAELLSAPSFPINLSDVGANITYKYRVYTNKSGDRLKFNFTATFLNQTFYASYSDYVFNSNPYYSTLNIQNPGWVRVDPDNMTIVWINASPSVVENGSKIYLVANVTNFGIANGTAVAPTLSFSSSSGYVSAYLVDGPTPSQANISAGSYALFYYNYTPYFNWDCMWPEAGANVSFSNSTGGFYAESNKVHLNSLSAFLIDSMNVTPSVANNGSIVNVRVAVFNEVQANRTALAPNVTFQSSWSNFTLVGGPSPSAANVSAGSSYCCFEYNYTVTAGNYYDYVDVSTTLRSGPPNYCFNGYFSRETVKIEVPPLPLFNISSITASPSVVSNGSKISVVLNLTKTRNTSEEVPAPALTVSGNVTASALLSEGPSPASANMSLGESKLFYYNYTALSGASGGNVSFSNGTVSSGSVTVKTPANITVVSISALPGELTNGSAINVTVNITNTGQSNSTETAPTLSIGKNGTADATLASGPSPASANISAGGYAMFNYTYTGLSGTSGGYLNFSADAKVSNNVRVKTNANFTLVSISAVPSSLTNGSLINVTLNVTNLGQTDGSSVSPTLAITKTGTADTYYLSGPSPASANIAAGASQLFTYTYIVLSGASGGNVSFSNGTVSSINVTIKTPASFSISSISAVPTSLTNGSQINVTLNLTNIGQTAGTPTVPTLTVLPNGTASATSLTTPTASQIAAGGYALFNYTYTAISGASGGYANFTNASVTSNNVRILVPANITIVSITAAPSSLTNGSQVDVTLNMTNYGQTTGSVTMPPIAVSSNGTASATLITNSASSDIAPGSYALYYYNYTALSGASGGYVNFTTSAPDSKTSNNVRVLTPANFSVSTVSAVPGSLTNGSSITVTVNLTNIGQTAGVPTMPALSTQSNGTASATLTFTPTASQIAAGSYALLNYSYTGLSGASGGYVNFSAGTTASNNVRVLTPANMSLLSISALPSSLTNGSLINVTLNVTNIGQTDGTAIAPTLSITKTGTADATLASGPTPANASIAAGGYALFNYTYIALSGANGGNVSFANGTVSSANVTIKTPAKFNISIVASPTDVTNDSDIYVIVNLTNVGQSNGVPESVPTITPATNGTASVAEIGMAGSMPEFIQPGSYTYFNYSYKGYSGASGGYVNFTNASVTSNNVRIRTPASFSVSTISASPSELTNGSQINVTLNITNNGQSNGTASAPTLSIGKNGTADAALLSTSPSSVNIAAGGYALFNYTYTGLSGANGGYLNFTNASTTSNNVRVFAPANFSLASISAAPSELTNGSSITVTVNLTNIGQTAGVPTMPALSTQSNGTASATLTFTPTASQIAAGSYSLFNYTYTALSGTSGGYVNFTNASKTSNNVRVKTPANFTILTISASPSELANGSQINVTVNITNAGQTDGTATAPTLSTSANGTATATLVTTSPSSANIAAGSYSVFNYTYTALSGNSGGYVNFTNSTTSNNVRVKTPVNITLLSIAALPSSLTNGSQINVTLNVTNLGQTDGSSVSPTLAITKTGTADTYYLSGPSPASANIAAGASQLFTYNYTALSGANGGTLTFVNNSVSSDSVTVKTPANFTIISITASPNELANGSQINVTLNLTNLGQTAGTPTVPTLTISANGTASATLTFTPTASQIAAGSYSLFNYTYTALSGASGGYLNFTNSTTSNNVKVNTPASFSVNSISATPSELTNGSVINVTVNITNVGQSRGSPAVPLLAVSANGTANATIVNSPQSIDLSPQSSTILNYTYTALSGASGGYVNFSNGTTVSNNVRILVPANVSEISLTAYPSQVANDSLVNVTLVVNNTGQTAYLNYQPPSLTATSNGSVSVSTVSTPSSLNLSGSSSVSLNYTYRLYSGLNGGYVNFSTTSLTSNTVRVLSPANFTYSISVSPTEVEDTALVSVNVTINNTGGATGEVKSPKVSANFNGTVNATLKSGPTPDSANITAGSSQVFAHTFNITSGTSGGYVNFSIDGVVSRPVLVIASLNDGLNYSISIVPSKQVNNNSFVVITVNVTNNGNDTVWTKMKNLTVSSDGTATYKYVSGPTYLADWGNDTCGNDIGWSYTRGDKHCKTQDCCNWYITTHTHDLQKKIVGPSQLLVQYMPGYTQGCKANVTVYVSPNLTDWTKVYTRAIATNNDCPNGNDTDGDGIINECWRSYESLLQLNDTFRYVNVSIPDCYNDYSTINLYHNNQSLFSDGNVPILPGDSVAFTYTYQLFSGNTDGNVTFKMGKASEKIHVIPLPNVFPKNSMMGIKSPNILNNLTNETSDGAVFNFTVDVVNDGWETSDILDYPRAGFLREGFPAIEPLGSYATDYNGDGILARGENGTITYQFRLLAKSAGASINIISENATSEKIRIFTGAQPKLVGITIGRDPTSNATLGDGWFVNDSKTYVKRGANITVYVGVSNLGEAGGAVSSLLHFTSILPFDLNQQYQSTFDAATTPRINGTTYSVLAFNVSISPDANITAQLGSPIYILPSVTLRDDYTGIDRSDFWTVSTDGTGAFNLLDVSEWPHASEEPPLNDPLPPQEA